MTYAVKITGNWWKGYSVVTTADGRAESRFGPYRKKRHARIVQHYQRQACGELSHELARLGEHRVGGSADGGARHA